MCGPAAMARLGLGYDDIRSVNPRIIYASATGYGAGGRYAGKPAYDDLIQGLSGIAAIARDAWGGEPRYMPLAIADRTVGLYLANAISAALFHRERTGEGQAIEIPMFEVFAEYLLGDHLAGLTFDPPEGPQYYPRLVSKHRRPYADQRRPCLRAGLYRHALEEFLPRHRPRGPDAGPALLRPMARAPTISTRSMNSSPTR